MNHRLEQMISLTELRNLNAMQDLAMWQYSSDHEDVVIHCGSENSGGIHSSSGRQINAADDAITWTLHK